MFKIILIAYLFFVFQVSARNYHIGLQEALDLKLVRAKAWSLGRYQGYCIKIELKNLTPDSLTIKVEAGRRLNSINDKEQDILIVKEELIALRRKETRSFEVKGYCCQAENLCPSKDSKYYINTLADSALVKVACYLNANEFDGEVEQQAVWSVSDDRSSATITSINDSLLKPLREMVAGLKHETLPWYTVLSKTQIYPNGVISTFPLSLRGEMVYSNDKESYVTLSVTNEHGLPVCQVKCEWLKVCSNARYKLELPVKGLSKGKYSVELKTLEKQLAKQEFEI